ncbi:sulfite exporter TauE/SafE family protein [Streptomyces sp. NPDC046862]|uniref:sulfite exporter TauE/SafE family protein n=1 Tax=Streptomyces sp. NPDC046862 TaxID=3154603 RepID=UPI0034569485
MRLTDSPWAIAAFVVAVVFTAYTVRGLTGFGSGPIVAPLLALVLDLRTVIAVSVFLQFVVGCHMVYRARAAMDRRVILRAALPGMAGGLAGAALLTYLPIRALLCLVGLCTLWYALRTLRARRTAVRTPRIPGKAAAHRAGALSGAMEGMFGAGGPPFVVFLSDYQLEKSRMRGTILGYFLLIDGYLMYCYTLVPRLGSGATLMDVRTLSVAAVLLLPAFVGALFGEQLHRRLSSASFHVWVSIVLAVSGIAALTKAL